MAHAIETTDHMFSARKTPWHALGTVTEEALTSEQAIIEAKLDWDVDMRPIFRGDENGHPTGEEVDGWYETVRTDIDLPLGIVGDDYNVIQNSEVFDFMDGLADTGELKFETAGSLRDSKVVWMLAKVDRPMVIDGDEHVPYLLGLTSHDRSFALTMKPTPVRVVCMNTLQLALAGQKKEWKVKHTIGATGKIDEARKAIGLSFEYLDAFEVEAAQLMEQKVDDEMFDKLMLSAFPNSENKTAETKRQGARDMLNILWHTSPTIGKYSGTGWGALNTFSEYEEWVSPIKGADDDDVLQRQRRNANRIGRHADLTPMTTKVHNALVAVR